MRTEITPVLQPQQECLSPPGMKSFKAKLCWKCGRLHPDLARGPGSGHPNARGYFKPSFSWRQSLTLGRIWIKAPIRIQVPRLPIGHSLQNGLFLQNRSYPILGHYHLKTLLVFPLREILLAALTTSHVGNIGLPPPQAPETPAG